MFFLPDKGCTFASEIDEWLGNGGEVLDPYMHVASNAKEGLDIREVLAVGPVTNFGNLGVVRDTAFIIALVS